MAICVTIMTLGTMENSAQGQYSEPCRAPAPSGFLGSGDSSARGFVELVPSLCVSERFDSNVFFRPSTAGLQREDYVTSVNPMLRVHHNGNYATGLLDIGGISETYVNNSGLNYLGSNGTLSVNLDNSIKRIIPNAGLSVSDAVSYAPLPPGFVNPVAGTSPGSSSNIQDVFSQGLFFQRSNRISNIGSVSANYAVTALTRVEAAYSHSLLRFLSDRAGLFDTTAHTGTVGGTTQLSGFDRLNARYSYVHTEFGGMAGPSFLFKTHTATVGWTRILTPSLTAEANGGGIVIEPGRTTYAVNAAVIYESGATRATLNYARSAIPSFVGVATQIIANVVSLSAIQQIGPQWELTGAANYSHSSGSSGDSSVKFESYGGSVGLTYLITRIWTAGLGYTYQRFDQQFGTTQSLIDRHVGMFSVRATWE